MTHKANDEHRKTVSMLSGLGVRDSDIAITLGITGPTLRKYYEQELAKGHAEANAKVAQSLFNMATNPDKPNVAAAIFWMKCRAGWRELDGGKKEEAIKAAESVASGEYSAAPVPLRVVR